MIHGRSYDDDRQLDFGWLHNLPYTAAAWWVGKPTDTLRVTRGMPLVVYHDLNDSWVTAREHAFCALGGPPFNASRLTLISLRRMAGTGTLAKK